MALNVLIVDDSMVMRTMIKKTLRLSGLPLGEVYEAGNGEEGLAVLREEYVDLVLVDLNMPIMDGEQMIDHLRQDPTTVSLPVLVVSTEGSFTRISLIRKKGAEFVHKPFTPEAILDAVKELTGGDYAHGSGDGVDQGSGPDF